MSTIKTAFEVAQAKAEAEASQWLAEHADQLADVDCPEQSYGERQGYEILDALVTEIAEDEVADGFWQDSLNGQTLLEDCCNMNVATLKCWRGVQQFETESKYSKPVGTRFNPVAYARKERKARKDRARHGIEFCYDKAGRVRSKGIDVAKAEREVKVIKVKRTLNRLDRRMAAVAAREALANK